MDTDVMDAMRRNISKISAKESLSIIQTYIDDRLRDLIAIEHSAGKIYMIVHKVTRKLAYIGSTVDALHQRFGGHRSFWKNNPESKYSKYIQDADGPDAFEIILIEDYPCNNRTELIQREMHYIREQNPPCNTQINKVEETALENHTKIEANLECTKCGYKARCVTKLNDHLNKKVPCNQGKYRCYDCTFRSDNRTSIYAHRKTCKGRKVTAEQNTDIQNETLSQLPARPESENATLNEEKSIAQQPIAKISETEDTRLRTAERLSAIRIKEVKAISDIYLEQAKELLKISTRTV